MLDKTVEVSKGKVSVSVRKGKYGHPLWSFCENGYQSTGVYVSKEQFEMMRELVTNHKIVEMYENGELS